MSRSSANTVRRVIAKPVQTSEIRSVKRSIVPSNALFSQTQQRPAPSTQQKRPVKMEELEQQSQLSGKLFGQSLLTEVQKMGGQTVRNGEKYTESFAMVSMDSIDVKFGQQQEDELNFSFHDEGQS